jgi:hypothetical protein
MVRRNIVANFESTRRFVASPGSLLVHFLIWQVAVITIYLGSRKREEFLPVFSNGLYLGVIALATLVLVGHLFFIKPNRKLDKQDIVYLSIFTLPLIVLYVAMFLNLDFRSMQSLTLIFIALAPIIIWRTEFKKEDYKIFNYTVAYYSAINIIFVFLQIFGMIPVAQINSRDFAIGISERPTGLLFNAFAMSYASVICLAIGINLILKNKSNTMGIIIASTSFISLILSGTRTSIWLGFLIIISMIIVSKIRNNQKTKVLVPSLLVILGVGAPFVLLLIGLSIGNTEWSTLNGRTQMWSCVVDRSSEFIPIGVGLDDAFPPKFCADSGWFSNLRHPENMFLLAFVESGPLGLMAYVLLFTFTIIKSFGAFKRKMVLPLILTATFLLSNLIYVSLFHYLPFLPNRPADRGIFNFHLFYLVWIWIMKDAKNSLEKKV